MNAPGALIGNTVESAAKAISQLGFVVTPDQLAQTAGKTSAKTASSAAPAAPHAGGGHGQLLHNIMPSGGLMAFWYHYAILFEALFILTTVDAGTAWAAS
jgi:Carbon starvation protein, predicted membrane protein